MKYLLIVGVCVLFVAVNSKTFFNDIDEDEQELQELYSTFEEELYEDRPGGPRIPPPGFPKKPLRKPKIEPPELVMRDIIEMLNVDRDHGMQMFYLFLADAVAQVVKEVQCYGAEPTWSPRKRPSGFASARPSGFASAGPSRFAPTRPSRFASARPSGFASAGPSRFVPTRPSGFAPTGKRPSGGPSKNRPSVRKL